MKMAVEDQMQRETSCAANFEVRGQAVSKGVEPRSRHKDYAMNEGEKSQKF